jgi:hypothetical protein
MANNNFSQQVYSDFSGGYNDTSAAISINDDQLTLSENADYAAEVKALQTRKGCSKVNTTSYGANVTDGYSWLVGSTFKKCLVMSGKVYDVDITTGAIAEKITLTDGAEHIYPFVMYDVLYFGDGSELYEWGATDHSTDMGTEVVSKDEIVRYNLATNAKGTKGHFYRLLTTKSGSVTYASENFNNTAVWEDVTDVENHSSGYVRKMSHYDPSEREIVTITVSSEATAAATITVNLGGEEKSFSCTANQTINSLATAIGALSFTNWGTGVVTNNAVVFTAKAKGAKDDTQTYINPSTSGATFTCTITQEGKDDDCDISEIKKCTVFCVHQGSYRVFAAGSPDDSALYYSEIGNGRYFKSSINKVYPAINGYGQVTAMINFSDYLLVSYENGWYSWTGTTPLTDATWKPLNIPYGCVSARTLCLTPSSFTFLGRDGVYCVSASIMSDDYILLESNKVIVKLSENVVEKTISSFVNMSLCEGIFYNNVYLLTYSTNGEYCDRVLKYEWDTSSFTLTTGWRVNRWLNDPEELYFASNNYLLKAFQGYSDIDTDTGEKKAINLHVKTKEYHLGTPISNKVAQLIGFIFQQHEEIESNVVITIRAGYQSYELTSQDLAESLIYKRLWGKTWGYREAIVKIAEIIMVSNTFQIEIENNNIDDPVTLIGIGFVYEITDIITPNIWKDEVLLK